jgi:hypothetical protein
MADFGNLVASAQLELSTQSSLSGFSKAAVQRIQSICDRSALHHRFDRRPSFTSRASRNGAPVISPGTSEWRSAVARIDRWSVPLIESYQPLVGLRERRSRWRSISSRNAESLYPIRGPQMTHSIGDFT